MGIGLLIVCLIFVSCSFRTAKNSFDCDLVQQSISSALFVDKFGICRKSDDLNLYDKTKLIGACDLIVLSCEKAIDFVSGEKYEAIRPDLRTKNSLDENLIILHRAEKINDQFRLYYWKPLTGAFLNLIYEASGDSIKYELVDSSSGAL